MVISEQAIANAALYYAVFAFDEGTPEQIRAAKLRFNELASDAYQSAMRSALMRGFHRPTTSEFRAEFMERCRKYVRLKGS